MTHYYSFQKFDESTMAKAKGANLPISTKVSVEICRELRGKTVARAKIILQEAMDLKKAIPYHRYNRDIGHRKKIGPGRFPIKASGYILQMIESVEANAQFKGLNVSGLRIVHISAQQGPKGWHYGRQSRRETKNSHIEIVVQEGAKEDKKDLKAHKAEKKEQGEKAVSEEKHAKADAEKMHEEKKDIKKEHHEKHETEEKKHKQEKK